LATLLKSLQAAERRDRFREYMRKLNPTAPPRSTFDAGLVVEDLHDPLLKGLVARADIEPSSQQLLMGCTGSGKTTLLLQAEKWLDQPGQIPLYIDVSAETDLTKLHSGALLASFGIHLLQEFTSRSFYANLEDSARETLRKAEAEIRGFAYGTTRKLWVPDPSTNILVPGLGRSSIDRGLSSLNQVLRGPGSYVNVDVPGKLAPLPSASFPPDLSIIGKQLELFVSATRDRGFDLVTMFDGLDRLPSPDKFWAVVDQDFRALRVLGVGVIATAPQSLLYGEGRAIAAHFDRTHQIRTLNPDPKSNDLKTVLVHRGGTELMEEGTADLLCGASGGVLRDLITLARDAGEEAYMEDGARVQVPDARVAIRQMGEAYLRGLGPEQIAILRRLAESGSFDVASSSSIELLAMGRVLEYSAGEFRVHPTLLPLLPSSGRDRAADEGVEQR
jgi:hypothetical protein